MGRGHLQRGGGASTCLIICEPLANMRALPPEPLTNRTSSRRGLQNPSLADAGIVMTSCSVGIFERCLGASRNAPRLCVLPAIGGSRTLRHSGARFCASTAIGTAESDRALQRLEKSASGSLWPRPFCGPRRVWPATPPGTRPPAAC